VARAIVAERRRVIVVELAPAEHANAERWI
jgi:hypothetical protein